MNNLKKILLKTRNLPFNLDKPLSDLLMLLGFIAVNGQENNIVGELYLTAEPSDKAFSICCADFIDLTGIKLSAECKLETRAERGEWTRCAKIAMLSVLIQAFDIANPPWGIRNDPRFFSIISFPGPKSKGSSCRFDQSLPNIPAFAAKTPGSEKKNCNASN